MWAVISGDHHVCLIKEFYVDIKLLGSIHWPLFVLDPKQKEANVLVCTCLM